MTLKSKVSINVILNEYFSWLCSLANSDQENISYFLLMKALHNKTFYWSVPNDDNRAFEGKNLREQFCDEMGFEYIYDDFPESASMLEVIIALAIRCENIMENSDGCLTTVEWIWKILSNIGLDKYTDDDYYELNDIVSVDSILNKIIDRTYNRNGDGGMFPLRRPKKDQRKVELWYQMSAYLVENYYAEDAVM